MTIIDKRRGGGAAADMAQQVVQRAIDTNVPTHVKTGVSITGIVIGPGGFTKVPHKLGRKITGWHTMRIVNGSNGSGAGGDLSEIYENASDDKTITFARQAASTGTFTYDVWVF